MTDSPLRIDWREAHRNAEPYVAGQGGVVAVAGYPTSACNTFVKLLLHAVQECDPRNVTLMFSPSDATTVTEDDIVVTLEQELDISPEAQSSVAVGTNIQAGGPVTVSGVNIYGEPTPYDVAAGNSRRARRIVEAVGEMLPSRRLVLTLYNWHKVSDRTRGWFWYKLWERKLERLTGRGLLVICAYTTDDGALPRCGLLLRPGRLIQLPPSYGQAERGYARQDMAKILVTWAEMEMQKAIESADTLLRAWSDHPAKVHEEFPGYLLRL